VLVYIYIYIYIYIYVTLLYSLHYYVRQQLAISFPLDPHCGIVKQNLKASDTQNYLLSGLCPETFRKLDLLPSSGEGMEEDSYSVGSL
jgi:hypothetical protein